MRILKLIWKKIIRLSVKQTALACAFAILFSTTITSYNIIVSSHYKSMSMTLNYDGAKMGLTPASGRFNISEIKSDEVVKNAISKLGDDSLDVDAIKKRITIDSKMPKTSLDNTVAAISSGQNYSYSPAEFTIYYSQKKKFGKNNTINFLSALSESYSDFFKEKYSDKNVVLEFDKNRDISGYDYDETCQLLTDEVNSMINYLGTKQQEGSYFKSAVTGYTYAGLINTLINLRDISINKLNAFIMQNEVSKDKDMFLRKYNYLINEEYRKYNMSNDSSNIINNALSMYDARITGVTFVPSVDDQNEFYMGRTKTGLDNLSKKSYNSGEKAIGYKKTIDNYENKYAKFQNSPKSTQEQYDIVEEIISEIIDRMDKISDNAIKTDDEYLTQKTNDYIKFSLPQKQKIPVVMFVKYIVIGGIIAMAAFRFWDIILIWLKRKVIDVSDQIVNSVEEQLK